MTSKFMAKILIHGVSMHLCCCADTVLHLSSFFPSGVFMCRAVFMGSIHIPHFDLLG